MERATTRARGAVVLLVLVCASTLCVAVDLNFCTGDESCPASYPVKSDPAAPGGDCEASGASSIRNSIVQEVGTLLKESVSPLLNQALQEKYLGQLERFPAVSCSAILQSNPVAASGEYWVQGENGAERVYCAMEEPCGAEAGGGGWMRVMDVNMSDPTQSCPGDGSSITEHEFDGVRVCTNENGLSCVSYFPPSYGVSWSKVCGRVIGYQFGSNDGVKNDAGANIDDVYMDGISLTHGNTGSREHIWSFIAFIHEAEPKCPCATNFIQNTPSFIQDNFFCEAGTNSVFDLAVPEDILHIFPDDPLWDGKQCGADEAACCETSPPPPWFHRELPYSTTDWLEFRVCVDEGPTDERVLFSVAEIYVQ